jgi:hypothetical protein
LCREFDDPKEAASPCTIYHQPHNKRSILPSNALRARNLIPPLKRPTRKRRNRRLHPNLDCLPRTQETIGNKLCARTGRQVKCRSVLVRRLLADNVGILFLEEFVKAVFSGALERVADEGGTPAGKVSADSFCAEDFGEGFCVGFVERGVDLAAAFYLNVRVYLRGLSIGEKGYWYQIEGGDGCVGDAAGDDAAEGADGIVLWRIQLNLAERTGLLNYS